jgi:hypothetical protein
MFPKISGGRKKEKAKKRLFCGLMGWGRKLLKLNFLRRKNES